jgi:chromate transporter
VSQDDRREDGAAPAREPVAFGEALRFWLKLGVVSFGGPAGQIAIMHQELVERRRWISENRFLHALNYCMVLPGPEAQQLATYIGWLMHRTRGGIAAGGLFVLPSLAILIALSWVYVAHGDVPAVAAALYGIKPAVTALVLFAAVRIGSRVLKNPLLWAIAVAAFVAIFALRVPFPVIVAAAALAGYVGARLAPARFGGGASHARLGAEHTDAVIADDTPLPPHAHFSRRRALAIGTVGVGVWVAAMALLAARYGIDGVLPQMGWFFTKAALLTFGGAYAVLPYVFQGAVEQHQWLGAAQMIDGLALGETTPGPLIMVVAFVGFVGGAAREILGPDTALASGALAASVVTFFTFLPSFVFIFLGAPFIETTGRSPALAGPLTGVTAAVVGVIVNLAAFFAWHVLWPQGASGPFDWPSALIGVAAFVALARFKAGVIPVILACGAAGLAVRLVV